MTEMKKPFVIGFYGYSGSGKTTLIEELIRKLRAAGVRTAVIKQSDQEIRLDKPGKDTYRFQEAGAEVTALASTSETDIILRPPMEIKAMAEAIGNLRALDLIIIESAADPEISKIRVGEIAERENTVWTYDGSEERLLEKINLLLGG